MCAFYYTYYKNAETIYAQILDEKEKYCNSLNNDDIIYGYTKQI